MSKSFLRRRQLLEEQRPWELHDLDREPDCLQVLLEDLRLSRVLGAVHCVENGLPGSRMALGKRARRAKVGTVQRVDALVPVTRLGR